MTQRLKDKLNFKSDGAPRASIFSDTPSEGSDNQFSLILVGIAVLSLLVVAGANLIRNNSDDFLPQQTAQISNAQANAPVTAVQPAPQPTPVQSAPRLMASPAVPAPVSAAPHAETVPTHTPPQAEPEDTQIVAQMAYEETPQVVVRDQTNSAPLLAIVDESTGALKELRLEDLRAITPVASPEPGTAAQPIQSRAAPVAAVDCVDTVRAIAKRSTVYFNSGGAQLTPLAIARLREIGAASEACPEAVIQVSGHSDASGDTQANIKISWQRADNTIAALESMGFDTSRMDPVGFGARLPRDQGDSAGDTDRRVEFQVMRKR